MIDAVDRRVAAARPRAPQTSTRATTTADRSAAGASALDSESRAMSASASAFIWVIVRSSPNSGSCSAATGTGTVGSTVAFVDGRAERSLRIAGAAQLGADERLDRELEWSAVRRIECSAQVDHAGRVFPDRKRTPRAQFVFARLDAVGVEVCGELLDERRESVDADDRGTIDQELLGRFELVACDTRRDAVEEPTDDVGRRDAEDAGLERRRDVRMTGGQRLASERGSPARGLTDRHQSCRVGESPTGRLRDEALGRSEPLPPGQVVAGFSSTRPLCHPDRAARLQGLDPPAQTGERFGDADEPVVAHRRDIALGIG